MGRKRPRPNPFLHPLSSRPKRRRPHPPPPPLTTSPSPPRPTTRPTPPPAVVVIGLPTDCSVLDVKSRFEIYGPISRIRLNHDSVGFITFRTLSAAQSAVSAALDPSFGITLDSKRVQVMWESENVEIGDGDVDGCEGRRFSLSKLVRAERPLSRHGRWNRLSLKDVGAGRSGEGDDDGGSGGRGGGGDVVGGGFEGREIVAYDDIM